MGARQWAQAEAWWGEAAVTGGRLGTEMVGISPGTNNSLLQTVSGGLWLWLGCAALARPPWPVWEEAERHLGPAASMYP